MRTYAELLLDNRWKAKREEILERDGNICSNCKNLLFVSESQKTFFKVAGLTLDGEITILYDEFKEADVVFSNRNYFIGIKLSECYLAYYIDVEGRNPILLAIRKCACPDPTKRKPIVCKDPKDFFKAFKTRDKAFFKKLLENESEINKLPWSKVCHLHVHHKYYQHSLKPWDYPDDALTTLCFICHEDLHKDAKVPVLDESGNIIGQYTNCYRCHGSGWFFQYKHVQGGICFRCRGAKYEELIHNLKT